MSQPYTTDDLKRGEIIVQELHGLIGYDAWAEHIAKAIAAGRKKEYLIGYEAGRRAVVESGIPS